MLARMRFSFDDFADERDEFNGDPRVRMGKWRKFRRYRNFNSQFFLQLAHERRFGSFTSVYFAARELPQTRVRLTGPALSGEEHAVPFDDAAGDRNGVRQRQRSGITGRPYQR